MSAASIAADERLARELQQQEENELAARMAASAGARAAAAAASPARAAVADAASGLSSMSAADREAALRLILNDTLGAGGGLGLTGAGPAFRRRTSSAASNSSAGNSGRDGSGLFLGVQPATGDEVAFYCTRVSGQQNRAALSLSVILSGDVQRCIMFNYCWDEQWLLEYFPQLLSFKRVDMVRGSSERGQGFGYSRRPPTQPKQMPFAPNFFAYEAPLPMAHGVHHSKLIISIYERGCRVAVCTANFIGVDWLWKNNVSFVQDFPRKNACSPPRSAFEDDLLDYLAAYRSCGLDVADELRKFDFSTAKAILIPSVPGFHRGTALHRYGHMKVRAVLSREPMEEKFASAPVIAQFSSVGSTSEKWVDELRASLGAQARPKPGGSNAAAAGTAATSVTSALMSSAASLPPLRLIWPNKSQVRDSLEGWGAGGSLCCDDKNMRPHLTKLLYAWDGSGQGRDRAMPHIKSYCRPAADGELAWMLTTSANMSNSAWGALQKDGTQLMIRHYEIGVLFTPSHYAHALAIIKARGLENFSCTESPLISSPKGPLSTLPYFKDRPASVTSAAAAANGASAAPAQALPSPPRVRLMLLPPLGHLTWPTAAATAAANEAPSRTNGAAAATAGTKRKLEAVVTDLTGDDDDEAGGAAAAAAAGAPVAKKPRGEEPSPTPVSVAASTVKLSAASAPTAAASSAVGGASEFTVLCPLPYNPLSRRYVAGEVPWVWNVNFLEADVHGNWHTPQGIEGDNFGEQQQEPDSD